MGWDAASQVSHSAVVKPATGPLGPLATKSGYLRRDVANPSMGIIRSYSFKRLFMRLF